MVQNLLKCGPLETDLIKNGNRLSTTNIGTTAFSFYANKNAFRYLYNAGW